MVEDSPRSGSLRLFRAKDGLRSPNSSRGSMSNEKRSIIGSNASEKKISTKLSRTKSGSGNRENSTNELTELENPQHPADCGGQRRDSVDLSSPPGTAQIGV